MIRSVVDKIGGLFVNRSPEPRQGYARFLETLPSRKLRHLAGTNAHWAKKKLVAKILTDMD